MKIQLTYNGLSYTADLGDPLDISIPLIPGNGTHTECVGHIAKEVVTINETLQNFHHIAQVMTIYPTLMDNGDRVILKSQIEGDIMENVKALVIRTMPNADDKLRRIYSGTNPPYLDHEAIRHIVEQGVEHLLLDLYKLD